MHKLPFLLSLIALSACHAVDRATVVVIPAIPPATEFAARPDATQTTVRRFESFTRANGYACHATLRNRQRNVCRGPRDLHMTFQPRLGHPGYVAGFSWVLTQGRTSTEFQTLVHSFADAVRPDAQSVQVTFGQFEE
jgi:hypothetical protein